MDHKIQGRGKLLTPDGRVSEPGWANALVLEYSPNDVKANKLRVKEWDYYMVMRGDGEYAFSTVQADNRYMGLRTATIFDFEAKTKIDWLIPQILPLNKLPMPTDSSTGDICYKSKLGTLEYRHENGGRRLVGKYVKTPLAGAMEFDIFMKQPEMDTMVIATPWREDPQAFYYNQKINCMPASGYVKTKDRTFEFDAETDFGTLDWGRGVWTYDNTWYWGSGNAWINGKSFGFNIGYGFGDTSAASENMIFYDGKCHKLDRLYFDFKQEDIMAPWKIVSSDGRFDMDFTPVYDNRTDLNIGVLRQDAHQIFGKLNGDAILDDGTKLEIRDVMVFNEQVRNKY